ncbi:hypothetical protein LUW77_15535 [Streptomyces radiopugnans]|nr:hypothetical protein LUW77_15535 [Streptomyces radiopugnans]
MAVVGRRVQAPVGLIHALRPHPADLAAVVVATSATDSRLTTLPILFPADLVRRVPDARADLLPRTVRELLESLSRAACRDRGAGHRPASARRQAR